MGCNQSVETKLNPKLNGTEINLISQMRNHHGTFQFDDYTVKYIRISAQSNYSQFNNQHFLAELIRSWTQEILDAQIVDNIHELRNLETLLKNNTKKFPSESAVFTVADKSRKILMITDPKKKNILLISTKVHQLP